MSGVTSGRAAAGGTLKGLAKFDHLLAEAGLASPWRTGSRHDHASRYSPDLELLGRILAIPVSEGATSQSGLLGKAVDAWFAHELRRAGFEPDAVWPREAEPRVLPGDVAALVQQLPTSLREEVTRRLMTMRSVAPTDARVWGRAYVKQVDVVMSSWQAGPELLLSTKTMDSSFGKNLPNRFEEAYGDAANLRTRHPLAAVGFAFLVNSAILAEPGQAARAIDMMYKLRDRGDGTGYTSTCLMLVDWASPAAVTVRTDAVPEDLGPGPFMETMVQAVLDAAPATAHQQARDIRRGVIVEQVPPDQDHPERAFSLIAGSRAAGSPASGPLA